MRRVLLSLAFLIFFNAVFSLEISVPENVSANVNWSLYSNLGSLNYDKIVVLLDDAKVYEASFGSNPFLEQSKIVSAYHYEKQVSISFFGLPEGKHPVSLKIFKDGTEIASASKEIIAFNPYTKEATERLEQKVNALESLIEGKIGKDGEILSALSEIRTGIAALEGKIASGEEKNANLESAIKKLESQMTAKAASDENTKASLEEIKSSIAKIESRFEQGQQPLFTGFVSFVRGNPVLALVLLVIVIILIVLVLIRKKRLMERNYLFDSSGFESEVHGVEAPESSGEGPKSKGRWASTESDVESSLQGQSSKSASKISWGDLIKRERS
ncbi:MAG: hypothetical protein QXK06_05850 [Candidatus Diapherotrites archaeon]